MILDEDFHEEEGIQLSDQEIFTQIWVKPTKIFRYLLSKKYTKFIVPLFITASIISTFNTDQDSANFIKISPIVDLTIRFFISAFIYYFYALLLTWTGRWMEGKATKTDLLIVVAYSMPPIILMLPILIIQFTIFGTDILSGGVDLTQYEKNQVGIFHVTEYLMLLLQLWSLWLVIIGISEAQNFTVGRAIGNIIFAGIVVWIFSLIFLFILGGVLSI
ncbi:MAG: YIP1 family protein [Bacteroidota bacterium]